MIRIQIKYKHTSLKKLVKQIEELKIMLEITIRESNHSSNEKMCKSYAEALQSPKVVDSPKHSQHTSYWEAEDCHDEEPSLGSPGLFTDQKYFIK